MIPTGRSCLPEPAACVAQEKGPKPRACLKSLSLLEAFQCSFNFPLRSFSLCPVFLFVISCYWGPRHCVCNWENNRDDLCVNSSPESSQFKHHERNKVHFSSIAKYWWELWQGRRQWGLCNNTASSLQSFIQIFINPSSEMPNPCPNIWWEIRLFLFYKLDMWGHFHHGCTSWETRQWAWGLLHVRGLCVADI